MAIIDARSGHWNKNLKSNWTVASSLDTVIRQLEIAHADLLPNLRSSPTLILTSDYGGQHKAATHETFSFLLADLTLCDVWNEERQRVRETFFADKRRMSFKGLNDRHRRNALLPFLAAADLIPGILTTVLVDKRFSDLHKLTTEERTQLPPEIATWPSHVLMKMTLIAHLGAVLIAGLSAPGQNLLWLTDNDDFVANDQRVVSLTPLFAGIIGCYMGHRLGHFRFGTMKCDSGDLQIEDLASIPDLASGAACEIPLSGTWRSQSALKTLLRDHTSPKALTILHWIGQRHSALKRLMLVIESGDPPFKIKVRALELYPE